MENVTGGAPEAGKVSDAATEIAKPAEGKKRGGKKGAASGAAPETAAKPDAKKGASFEIDPAQLQEALRPLFAQLSKVTRTAPPIKTKDVDEIGAIAETFSYGLRNTKLGVDEKSGPWVPFGIVMGAYIIPRVFEGVMNFLDEREKRRADAESKGTFRKVAAASGGSGSQGETASSEVAGPGSGLSVLP
jgi:hypothetical protein